METLKYKIIKTVTQYNQYCEMLENLLNDHPLGKVEADEVDLLTLLIQKWDEENSTFKEIDPIRLLRSLMAEHKMNAQDLVVLLKRSKGYISEILNYKKGLSKEVIRTLAENFKISQEAFNKEYKLKVTANSHLRDSGIMNTKKNLAIA